MTQFNKWKKKNVMPYNNGSKSLFCDEEEKEMTIFLLSLPKAHNCQWFGGVHE